ESTMTMSAMGRMEVSDSMILSLSACVIYGPPFAVYGGLLAVFLFYRRDLIDSALMFCLPREGRCKEGLHNVEPQIDAHHAAAERQNVGVVVKTGHLRGERLRAERAADAGHFVGGDGDSDARRADKDPFFAFTRSDGFRRLQGKIGIVARIEGIRSEIDDFVPLFVEVFDHRLFE